MPTQRYSVSVTDALSLPWAVEQAALWPMHPLETIVRPGSYDLALGVDIANGAAQHRLLSNDIEVQVDR